MGEMYAHYTQFLASAGLDANGNHLHGQKEQTREVKAMDSGSDTPNEVVHHTEPNVDIAFVDKASGGKSTRRFSSHKKKTSHERKQEPWEDQVAGLRDDTSGYGPVGAQIRFLEEKLSRKPSIQEARGLHRQLGALLWAHHNLQDGREHFEQAFRQSMSAHNALPLKQTEIAALPLHQASQLEGQFATEGYRWGNAPGSLDSTDGPTLADNLLPLLQHYEEQYRHLSALPAGPRRPAHEPPLLAAVANDYSKLHAALVTELSRRRASQTALESFKISPTLLELPANSQRRIGATYRKNVHIPVMARCDEGANCLSASIQMPYRQMQIEREYFESGELAVVDDLLSNGMDYS
jgi:hypothetical protein